MSNFEVTGFHKGDLSHLALSLMGVLRRPDVPFMTHSPGFECVDTCRI